MELLKKGNQRTKRGFNSRVSDRDPVKSKSAMMDVIADIESTGLLRFNTKELRDMGVYAYTTLPKILYLNGYIDENYIKIKKIDISEKDISAMVRDYHSKWRCSIKNKEIEQRLTTNDLAKYIKLPQQEKNFNISDISDIILVEELRSRGYDVKCFKQIEL